MVKKSFQFGEGIGLNAQVIKSPFPSSHLTRLRFSFYTVKNG